MAVVLLGKFTTVLLLSGRFLVEPVTLRLPVVVSAVVCHYGNAATFKENYNKVSI